MLENEISTIDLSGNVNQAQPPVFNPIDMGVSENVSVTSGYSQVVSSPVIPVQQVPNSGVTIASTAGAPLTINMNNDTIQAGTVVAPTEQSKANETSVKDGPIIVEGDITIPANKLKAIISQTSKISTGNQQQAKTCVLNLIVNELGLTVRVTSGVQDLEIIDKTYSFRKSLEVAVDVSLFSEFVNSLGSENLVLKFDDETKVLSVNTGIGEFKFPQKNDATGKNLIMNELTFDVPLSSLMSFDYNGLVEIFNANKGIRASASKIDYLSGTYLAEIACATNGNVMILRENIKELQNDRLFIKSAVCDLIRTLAFNPETVKIGFVRNPSTNGIEGLVVSDGVMTLCSSIEQNNKFEKTGPLTACENFWNAEFSERITVDTKTMLQALKPIIPFIKKGVNTITKEDILAITIDGGNMKLLSLNGEAQNMVHIVNANNFTTKSPIYVQVASIYNIVQNIVDDRFDILINPSDDAVGLCIVSGQEKYIVVYENNSI